MERADKLDHQLDVNENELEGEGDEAQEEVEHKEDEDQKNAKDAEMDEEDANVDYFLDFLISLIQSKEFLELCIFVCS